MIKKEKNIKWILIKSPWSVLRGLMPVIQKQVGLDIKEVTNAPLAVCQEVGWMVHNGEEKIIIMRSYSKDKEDITGGGAIAIPKGWLKKIEYLTVSYAEN